MSRQGYELRFAVNHVAPYLLITDPALATAAGRYFDRFTDTRAHEQAYDPAARARLDAVARTLIA
ncbi:hypothetical protein [Streptomyces sp. NPDC056227]|uniref:hypothetical protein n=1 Tax=Streptomyces sp. NPDC056227 TaxID=3345753 RepID=UPI0035E11D8C